VFQLPTTKRHLHTATPSPLSFSLHLCPLETHPTTSAAFCEAVECSHILIAGLPWRMGLESHEQSTDESQRVGAHPGESSDRLRTTEEGRVGQLTRHSPAEAPASTQDVQAQSCYENLQATAESVSARFPPNRLLVEHRRRRRVHPWARKPHEKNITQRGCAPVNIGNIINSQKHNAPAHNFAPFPHFMFLGKSLCAGALRARHRHTASTQYARFCARCAPVNYARCCAHYACAGACTARAVGQYGQHTVTADKTLRIIMKALCAAAGGLRV